MSHIIKKEKNIEIISDLLNRLNSEYKEELLEELLYILLPTNPNIKIEIGDFNKIAYFDPINESIKISSNKTKEQASIIATNLSNIYTNFNKEELLKYYILHILVHEVEHSYQYLIGYDKINCKFKTLAELYKYLFGLEINTNDNQLYIKLKKHLFTNEKVRTKDTFVLERNANIEAYEVLSVLSNYENNKHLLPFFLYQMQYYLSTGYKLYNGAFKESYNKLWLGSLFNSIYQDEYIPLDARIKHGLPIDKDTRKKILRNEYVFKQQ